MTDVKFYCEWCGIESGSASGNDHKCDSIQDNLVAALTAAVALNEDGEVLAKVTLGRYKRLLKAAQETRQYEKAKNPNED